MGSIKPTELPGFLGRTVIVQEDLTGRGDLGDDYREVQGKVTAANSNGLVIQTRKSVVMVRIEHILDVEELTRSTVKRLVRRWIRHVTEDTVKQHLVDRHGFPWDIVSAPEVSAAVLLVQHNRIDHTNLGHQHGTKPPSTRGRRPEIPGQRKPEHDNHAEIVDEESDE